jgi:hypothetical protein
MTTLGDFNLVLLTKNLPNLAAAIVYAVATCCLRIRLKLKVSFDNRESKRRS